MTIIDVEHEVATVLMSRPLQKWSVLREMESIREQLAIHPQYADESLDDYYLHLSKDTAEVMTTMGLDLVDAYHRPDTTLGHAVRDAIYRLRDDKYYCLPADEVTKSDIAARIVKQHPWVLTLVFTECPT